MFKKFFLPLSLVLGTTLVCSTGNAAELQSPVTRMKTPSGIKSAPTAVIIPCPSKLNGVNLSITAQYSAPSGWTGKMTPTGYQGQTLTISMHQVLGGKMNCTYAQTSLPSSYRLTTVSKPIPAGKTCTAVAGFKFSCQ